MKPQLLGLALSAAILAASPVYAENKTVEEAIRNRDDLSTFYNALVINGVFDQLKDDTDYTIFAPTNEAFKKLSIKLYPCFYSGACKEEASAILRNHFVEGAYNPDDITHGKASFDTINANRPVHIDQPSRNDFAVDGNNILYMSAFFSGKIYKIDGVIAEANEIAGLTQSAAPVAAAEPPATPPVAANNIPENPCEMDDCSDRAAIAPVANANTLPTAPEMPVAQQAPQGPVMPWLRPPAEMPDVPMSAAQPEAPLAPPAAQPMMPEAPAQAPALPGEESSLHILRLPGPKVAEPPASPPVAAPYVDVASNDLPAPGIGPVGGHVHLTAQESEKLARSVFEPDESAPEAAAQVAHVQPVATAAQSVPTHFANIAPTHLASIAPSPHAPFTAADFRSPAAD